MARLGIVVVALLVISGALVAGMAIADQDDEPEEDETVTVGDQMTTLMHSSESEAEGAVDEGMFEATYAQSGGEQQQAQLLEERTNQTAERLANLQERKTELQQRRDELSPAQYRAEMSRVLGELRSINRSLDHTDQRAQQVGADRTRIQQLRQNASELSGGEVAEIARGIGGVNPPGLADNRTGPPDDAGPPDNNETGPPDDAGPPDDSETGPPDDQGPTDDHGPPGDEEDDDGDQNEEDDSDRGGGGGGDDDDRGPPDDGGPP